MTTMPNRLTSMSLASISRAGRAGDQAALPALRALAASASDPHQRAYAAWAAWTIAPEPIARRTWRVDPGHGDDQGDGAVLRTIAEAMQHARPGDTVMLAPGRYCETIEPWLGGTAEAPLTIAADGPGVKILAHDPWSPEWRNEGDGCWSADYRRLAWDRPEEWEGVSPDLPSNRCEQMWCDDALLVHQPGVATLREGARGFATVDAADARGGRLWLRVDGPPHGRISRSQRRQGLCPLVRGLGHLVVRGLDFVGGAAPKWTGGNWLTCGQDAVVAIRGGHHWLIEDCDIGFGDAQGIELGLGGFSESLKRLPVVWADPELNQEDMHKVSSPDCGGTVVRNCRVHDHAIAGIVGIGATDRLRITGCDVDRNGRKDNDGTCEEAGIKIHSARDCLIDRNRVRWNRAYGIWLDCECLRNRVTGNILIDNDNHQLFHEISAGPAWFDSNVVLDTRDRGTGFYTHDGSRCLVANNLFRGCATGVRVRALFHRKHGDSYTRTCDNHVACNLIDGASAGAISFMPEKPRNERNHASGNAYWLAGAAPRLRLENTGDVGVQWQDTAYGRATGIRGGGDALVDLATWQTCFDQDPGAAVVPARLILGDEQPERLRDRLAEAAERLGLGHGLPDDWQPRLPGAAGWIAAVAPELGLGEPRLTVHTAPDRGFAQWDGHWLAWHGDSLDEVPGELVTALAARRLPDHAPLALATGGQGCVDCRKTRVLHIPAGLQAEADADGVRISSDTAATPGAYHLILANDVGWWLQPVRLASTLVLGAIIGEPDPAGHAVLVEVFNHADAAAPVTAAVEVGQHRGAASATIPARSRQSLRVPIEAADAGEALVSVQPRGLSGKALVCFARAGHGVWGTSHDLNAFPGGCYPDGAWAFVLYQGTIRATWRARWDADALHVEVRCVHAKAHQNRPDPHGWHTGCAAFLSVRPGCGMPGTEIGLALRSDTGEALCGFRKSIDPDRYQIAPTSVLPFNIRRTGAETLYTVALPWSVLGVPAAPAIGTDLPFSVMVSQNDGTGAYGLQWFFGIEYGHHENDEAWMGRLRLT